MAIPELPTAESINQRAREDSCRLNGQISDIIANTSVRQAATGDSSWAYRELSDFLYQWFERFNHFFFQGQLPQGVISFEKTRSDVLGHFVMGRNDYGILYNINLNKKRLARSEASLLEVLLHEMLHLHQFVTHTAAKGKYHNRSFVDKAASLGLHVRLGKGCHDGPPTDPFVSLLREHGVSFEPRVSTRVSTADTTQPKQERQRLRRWSCKCKSVWCGGALNAICLACEQQFQLNPTKGGN